MIGRRFLVTREAYLLASDRINLYHEYQVMGVNEKEQKVWTLDERGNVIYFKFDAIILN